MFENGRETENPFADVIGADDDDAKAGIIERMATVAEDDIKYISSAFDHITAQQLAEALNSAAAHRTDAPENFYTFYDLTAYLSDVYSSDEEHFILRAGLEENFVNILYQNGSGVSEEGVFSDSTLYWLIRNNYRTEENIEMAYYNKYRDIIEDRALECVQNAKNMDGNPVFTGYKITRFERIDVFETDNGEYEVYSWDVAFPIDTNEVMKIAWAGGMYLDAEERVRAYEQETYFVVKTMIPDAEYEYRFLFWDLYNGPDEATGRENALYAIETAFSDS